jgi:hypothetical protein
MSLLLKELSAPLLKGLSTPLLKHFQSLYSEHFQPLYSKHFQSLYSSTLSPSTQALSNSEAHAASLIAVLNTWQNSENSVGSNAPVSLLMISSAFSRLNAFRYGLSVVNAS